MWIKALRHAISLLHLPHYIHTLYQSLHFCACTQMCPGLEYTAPQRKKGSPQGLETIKHKAKAFWHCTRLEHMRDLRWETCAEQAKTLMGTMCVWNVWHSWCVCDVKCYGSKSWDQAAITGMESDAGQDTAHFPANNEPSASPEKGWRGRQITDSIL